MFSVGRPMPIKWSYFLEYAVPAFFVLLISPSLRAQVPYSVTALPSPAALGAPVAVTFTGGSATVAFYSGADLLGVRSTVAGSATLTTRLLPAGANQLRIAIDCGTGFSTSSIVTEVVNATPANALRSGGTLSAGSTPAAAAIADFNGDGKQDIAIANAGGDNVSVFLGNGDGTFRAAVSYAAGAQPQALVAADFNGDGRPDFAVGNVGLNTQYRASPAAPALLFSGDFGGDASTQLLEGYYEEGRLYPWRTRRDLGVVFPSLLKRYAWHREYARATLEEVFGGERLQRAFQYS